MRQFKLTDIPHNPHSDDAKDDSDDGIFRLCRETAYESMIACDGADFPYEWFDFDCIGLTEEPEDE